VKQPGTQQLLNPRCGLLYKLLSGVMALLASAMCLSASYSEQAGNAEIVDSGSTNSAGFRIVVDRSGQADYTTTPRKNSPQTQDKGGTKRLQLSRELADRFYTDLKAAKPFSSLPAQHCMKSASFGTTISIEFGGEKTPDLNCGDGGNGKLQAIIRDANEIVALFGTNERLAPPVKPE
jgi:hypothetical protein